MRLFQSTLGVLWQPAKMQLNIASKTLKQMAGLREILVSMEVTWQNHPANAKRDCDYGCDRELSNRGNSLIRSCISRKSPQVG
jgi:hypothetical protein